MPIVDRIGARTQGHRADRGVPVSPAVRWVWAARVSFHRRPWGPAFFAAPSDKDKDMSQSLVDTHLAAEQWAVVDQLITQLEQALAPLLVALAPDDRRRVVRMGDGSEAFCRKALDAMTENSALLPRNLDVEEMRRDLASHDALNARNVRLSRLLEKVRDTDTALGSDVMACALEGYAFLKIAGKSEGLSGLRRELGKRFENNGPRRAEPADAVA
jgi:hypothetical protein